MTDLRPQPTISKTPDWDPRFDKAQSVDGAKARYIELECYGLADLERDLDRLIRGIRR